MVKMCPWHPDRRCYRSGCSVFDCASGSVFVCFLHGHPNGFFERRKVLHFCRPLFSKHLRGSS